MQFGSSLFAKITNGVSVSSLQMVKNSNTFKPKQTYQPFTATLEKNVNEYEQDISDSHTAEQPTAP